MQEQTAEAEEPLSVNQSRVLISGASGLIGKELTCALRGLGVSVTRLSRKEGEPDAIFWDPEAGKLDAEVVSGFDAVIHLAGEPVGTWRWTDKKKQKIYDSRIQGTKLLVEALATASMPPKVFLCASGINYYGDSGNDVLDETSPAGTGFLSEVCIGWEASAAMLSAISRVVTLRIGVVLSGKGGMLEKMLPVFRLGLGGYVGRGGSYLSWITLTDLVRAMIHILHSEHLQGPVNMVSPSPVTGREFASALGKTVGRPAWWRIPTVVMRLVLGEFAEETILSSIRALPVKLTADGFDFQSATIQKAFIDCLKQEK